MDTPYITYKNNTLRTLQGGGSNDSRKGQNFTSRNENRSRNYVFICFLFILNNARTTTHTHTRIQSYAQKSHHNRWHQNFVFLSQSCDCIVPLCVTPCKWIGSRIDATKFHWLWDEFSSKRSNQSTNFSWIR